MSEKKKVNEQFLRLSMEHTLIIEYIGSFEKIIRKSNTAGSFPEFKKVMKVFKKDILDHFNLEERVLFPAALACLTSLEIVDTVLSLQKEHGYLERDLDSLYGHIRKQERTMQTLSVNLVSLLKAFTRMLKNHAQIEIESVFRPMDENRRCGRILRGFIIPS
jgi:hemerythrin-like domain-containing protein